MRHTDILFFTLVDTVLHSVASAARTQWYEVG